LEKIAQLASFLALGFTLTSVCTTCNCSTLNPEATKHQQVESIWGIGIEIKFSYSLIKILENDLKTNPNNDND
jgi:hypothetical protein